MIINMVHPGRGIFGSDFGTTSFVISKQRIKKYIGRYYRLFDSQGEVHSIEERRRAFLDGRGLHLVQQDNFEKIPGMPIAYWLQRQIYEMYGSYKTMAEIAEPKVGMQTSNNDKYLRFWHEIRFDEFRGSSFGLKWIKYLKGGAYRKWYGNLEYLLFYNKTPDYILSQKNARVLDLEFLKKKKCTWTDLTISKNSFRIAPDDTFYDISGHCFFPKEKDQLWLLGYVNTSIFAELLKVFNSTIHCQVGDVGKIIVPNIESQKKKVSDLAEQNVNFSKVDWDSFETSWDFVGHPLTQGIIEDGLIMDKYKDWKTECDTRFNQLKANEEELNRIFIDIYGLQNEFSPEVDDKDVTIRKADLQRDIKSLISYAVGCMFGRYSIYKQGLIYAGGNFNEVYGDFPIEVININPNIAAHGTALYKYGAPIDTYEKVYLKDIEHMEDAEMFWGVTESNIIPITDDEYFADDIVGQFMDFIRIVYGEKSLEENLKFIADALGGKGQPREVIRNYFLNDFYKDHCKIYQKRPIYWLFDSGKKNGFKCLIYMHRYEPDTIARIRTDYVHEQQSRYRTAIADLEHRIANAGTSERVKLNKSLKKIQEQADELHTYEEKIHHLADQMIAIDLDDGVKHNYEIFKDVLAKIK